MAKSGNGQHDIVVVGGGIFGASIAFHLAEAGFPPMLLERHGLADGPTGRSSANVRLLYTTPELAEIAWSSWQLLDRFHERVGGECDFHRVGVMYGISPDQASVFEAIVLRLASVGEPIATTSVEEMERLVPGFRLDGLAMGVWEPRSGYADPVATTLGFADGARRFGATVRVNTSVAELVVTRHRISGVDLKDGTRVMASRVVLATGPWTRRLLARAGIELPTYPERHAITILAARKGSQVPVPSVFADRVNHFYARPEGDSLVLLGGHTSRTRRIDDADSLDPSVPLEESAEQVRRAAARIPALGAMGIRPGYASVYDMSPDRFPIVDAVPGIKGLYVVAGTSGHGFKLAAGLGSLVADLVLNNQADLLRPFRFDRDFRPTGELSA